MARTDEYILCAAIHIDDGARRPMQPVPSGYVIGDYRHARLLDLAGDLAPGYRVTQERQGFLTSHGRFLSRDAALGVAKAAGQIRADARHLISEDLWTRSTT